MLSTAQSRACSLALNGEIAHATRHFDEIEVLTGGYGKGDTERGSFLVIRCCTKGCELMLTAFVVSASQAD